MFNRLQELGIPAKMTRTQDEYLPKEDRIRRILSLYNNSPNTLLISNHINAGGGEGSCGKLTFFEIKKRFIYL